MPSIKFKKIVGKTLQTGKVTVPKKFDSFLDKHLNCPIGCSIDVEYTIEGKREFNGRLYQSINNTTTYYQFYLIGSLDKEIFEIYCDSSSKIYFEFETDKKTLFISNK